ncbi:hypothetical protein ACFFX0_24310 [Citricoccus parietis]|uniref:Uncharacterized protein n=1 Tax=Citricoccus parietis TaxID=592307 RepID=A0ABV5G5C3_9MICC
MALLRRAGRTMSVTSARISWTASPTHHRAHPDPQTGERRSGPPVLAG